MTLPNKRWIGIAAVLLFLAGTCGCGGSSETERLYFSIAMDGQTYGYQETVISRAEHEGRPVILITERGRGLVSALGAEINTQTSAEYKLDPDTWRLVSAESVIDQGSLRLRISASVEGNKARIRIDPGGGEKEVELEPGVIFENPIFFKHLLRDFGDGTTGTKSYRVLELLDRKVWDVTYTRTGTEVVELAGLSFRAIVLDSLTPDIGLKLRLWIDAENGTFLKLETPQSVVARAEKSVKRGIARADYDTHIFARAGAKIEDIEAISYLRARAALEPVGNWITTESLNVPGQNFKGTVVDNRVEGVFEVRHSRYDGKDAPAYPPDFGGRPELEPYLSPEDFIESDDPVLVRKAGELTEGAEDSWDAAKRLSRWVADNIGYDIPGGASARNTYDIREGECGGHSRLFAAFCRAAGIPARVVWGCMYVPNNGGSFGQHAWNEVYMGDVGWVPLDTTAREVDFADSGHIRLGLLSSAHVAWNPAAMEILDFQAGPQKFGRAPERSESPDYEPYSGKFSGPRGMITVFAQDAGLSIRLADGRTFGLRDPDEEGKWVFKLTRDVNVLFERAGSGRITGLILSNKVRIPKRAAPQEIPDDVPSDLRSCLGQYPIPMAKQEISIIYRKEGLVMLFPGGRRGTLEGPDENGLWLDKSSGDRYSFVRDEDGTVRTLILHETVRCTKIE